MPAAKSNKAHKFDRPFHAPYRVVATHENGVEVCPVDKPQSTPIRVALNRVCPCPTEVADEFWPPGAKRKAQSRSPCEDNSARDGALPESRSRSAELPVQTESPGIWTHRLKTRRPRTSVLQPGDV